MKDMCEAYLDQSDFLLAVRDATTLIDEFGLFFLLCLLNPRKPEQADDLLDKMRDLRDTTEEVDNTLMENAEDGLDNADLDDLMAELEQSMEEDEKIAAGHRTGGLPEAPGVTNGAEIATEPIKLPEAPIADPVNSRPLARPKVSTPKAQPIYDTGDQDLEDMLNDL